MAAFDAVAASNPHPVRDVSIAALNHRAARAPVNPLDWRFPSFCVLEAKPGSFRIMVTAPGAYLWPERSLFSWRGLFLCISAFLGKKAFPYVCGLQSVQFSCRHCRCLPTYRHPISRTIIPFPYISPRYAVVSEDRHPPWRPHRVVIT